MLEQTRPFGESANDGLTGLDNAVATETVGGMVTVSHGVFNDQLPVGNMSVGEIRRRYADRIELNPHSEAQIDGHPARDDEVVRPGQMLMFLHDAGEKGAEGTSTIAGIVSCARHLSFDEHVANIRSSHRSILFR